MPQNFSSYNLWFEIKGQSEQACLAADRDLWDCLNGDSWDLWDF
jgi:hypothetical protein